MGKKKSLEEMNVEELYQEAKRLKIPGRSNMLKADLLKSIQLTKKQHAHTTGSTYGEKVKTKGFFDASKLAKVYQEEINDHHGCRICARNRAKRCIHVSAKTEHIIKSLENKEVLSEREKQTLKIARRNQEDLQDFINKTIKKYNLKGIVEEFNPKKVKK